MSICTHNRKPCPICDPDTFIKRRVKNLLGASLKYLGVEKRRSWTYYLGADWDVVVTHLQNKIHNWNNQVHGYDTRNLHVSNMVVDHIRPKKKFLNDAYASRETLCNHYTNLQPMLPEDNTFKGCHWSNTDEEHWILHIIMKASQTLYYPVNLQPPSLLLVKQHKTDDQV